jgi:hypothetical protein
MQKTPVEASSVVFDKAQSEPFIKKLMRLALTPLSSVQKHRIKKLLAPFLIYLIQFILKHPRLKFRLLGYLKNHPFLYDRLRQFTKNRNILVSADAMVGKVLNPPIGFSPELFSPSAQRVYKYLQTARTAYLRVKP